LTKTPTKLVVCGTLDSKKKSFSDSFLKNDNVFLEKPELSLNKKFVIEYTPGCYTGIGPINKGILEFKKLE
jgi:hypothetical protein